MRQYEDLFPPLRKKVAGSNSRETDFDSVLTSRSLQVTFRPP